MATLTLSRPDITADQISGALQQSLGPRYHVRMDCDEPDRLTVGGARHAHPRRARSIAPSPPRMGVRLLAENIGDLQIIDDLVDVRRPSDR